MIYIVAVKERSWPTKVAKEKRPITKLSAAVSAVVHGFFG
jgi:hypothetical protein